MAAKNTLSSSDRRFFALVAEAAFANPFSDARVEVDLRILEEGKPLSRDERLQRLQAKVEERVAALARVGRLDLRTYGSQDQDVLRIAYLFDIYHRYFDSFDRLIQQQIRAGDKSCPVPFASEALDLL